jgi:hypothetical protein
MQRDAVLLVSLLTAQQDIFEMSPRDVIDLQALLQTLQRAQGLPPAGWSPTGACELLLWTVLHLLLTNRRLVLWFADQHRKRVT